MTLPPWGGSSPDGYSRAQSSTVNGESREHTGHSSKIQLPRCESQAFLSCSASSYSQPHGMRQTGPWHLPRGQEMCTEDTQPGLTSTQFRYSLLEEGGWCNKQQAPGMCDPGLVHELTEQQIKCARAGPEDTRVKDTADCQQEAQSGARGQYANKDVQTQGDKQ